MSPISAIILAAGKGTRMKSTLPKVLHQANGKAMISYITEAAIQSGVQEIVLVVGHEAEKVRGVLGEEFSYAMQTPQLGTGHALQCALPAISSDCQAVLVLCGDTPLLKETTIIELLAAFSGCDSACTILSTVRKDPAGYGRIIRDHEGQVVKIVEERDASEQEKAIQEVNTAIYCFSYPLLLSVINELKNDNKQQEYYLTDVIGLLTQKGHTVDTFVLEDQDEVMGVNDRVQLSYATDVLRRRKNQQLMLDGVSLVDADHTYIEPDVQIGSDTIIEPNTFIRGKTVIGSGCRIGPNCDISDSQIGDDCQIIQSMMIGCCVADKCIIGPFSYMRPGTTLAEGVKIGGFVETKKAQIGKGSKVPHLSYMGDAEIGEGVNIGCGTITCNYDGYGKYKTIIEDGAFIGSNTNLIAPITIGRNATVAAGSSIGTDVPEEALAIERASQANIEGWVIRKREKMSNERTD
ncbi:MAG: bifunctional UDP-N-acetylglucosamine diphosphorylase/glucosamine-1-phosphate N-acetyltransferase GlmU [Bacillota bacterium]|jgi:bifunctional UDP-N-acetylglucosamine pyrophosphorylase/glucosamine-1-phosphate N-acetyltransferase